MKVWIFANGEIDEYPRLKKLIDREAFIIAADGGLKHIRNMNLTPKIVIGDFDSISKEDDDWLNSNKIEKIQSPVEKDETDLELAIRHALDLKPKQIRIAGALGGRSDQILGNIYLLTHPELEDIDIRMEDGVEEVFVIRTQSSVLGNIGETVSLIPLTNHVSAITTEGLRFALEDETLLRYRTRGISNVLTNKTAHISVGEGLLLCVHTHKIQRKV